MWKTLIGLIIALGVIFGCSLYEIFYVTNTVNQMREKALALFHLTEEGKATHEDGNVLRLFWEHKKKQLHVWLPHTAIENVDYHLNEALGYLYQENYEDALPKLEVIVDMTENIIRSISVLPENVF